ncbi:MAG: hypothetical protein P8P45_05730 [Flavobacteriales bacterium]|nr:hypothetical protein [Flavobacteriales bacterium]
MKRAFARLMPQQMYSAWLAMPLMLLLFGCGEATPESEAPNGGAATEQPADSEGMMPARRQKAFKKIFFAVPSPIETAMLLERSGIRFDASALNDVNKATGYATLESQAVNLGIYSGDLSYSVIFNQNQQSVDYLNTCRRLCDGLGVGDIISADLIARADNNRDVRDSLVSIVTETFYALNARFSDNDMEEASALMAAGGWIEGVYLGTRRLDTATEDLKLRIAEQKMTLENLLGLVDSYSGSDALSKMKASLREIEAAFAGVRITENDAAATAEEDGTVVISGGPMVEFDQATMMAISESVAKIRNQYAQ